MLEHFVVAEYARVELAGLFEIVGFDDKVGDTDDRRPFDG